MKDKRKEEDKRICTSFTLSSIKNGGKKKNCICKVTWIFLFFSPEIFQFPSFLYFISLYLIFYPLSCLEMMLIFCLFLVLSLFLCFFFPFLSFFLFFFSFFFRFSFLVRFFLFFFYIFEAKSGNDFFLNFFKLGKAIYSECFRFLLYNDRTCVPVWRLSSTNK